MPIEKDRLAALRAAASLKNYKEACDSQWMTAEQLEDADVEVEENEIPVQDVVSLGLIEKDDLVILSDGKCYSKTAILCLVQKLGRVQKIGTDKKIGTEKNWDQKKFELIYIFFLQK